MNTVTLHVGDVRDVLTTMIADGDTFDLLVTSPPFLALRSYLPADHPDQAREIGSEPTPAACLDTLYGLTADWGRLLPEWASICGELGDTMSGSTADGGDNRGNKRYPAGRSFINGARPVGPGWPLAKSMCILPHAYTLGLAYGINPLTGTPTPAGQWRIRNVITWARPNPPVGSLGKRNPQKRTGDYKFRPACSYITVACRGTGRYFDLDAVRTGEYAHPERIGKPINNGRGDTYGDGVSSSWSNKPNFMVTDKGGAPPLDWHTDRLDGDWLWKLATAPYPGAHYATYPLTLPRRLILAMCPSEVCIECGWPRERIVHIERRNPADDRQRIKHANGERPHIGRQDRAPEIGWEHDHTTLGFTDCGHDNYRSGRVLDPFAGSGTTAVAAALEGRDCTLIDLDPRNVDLIRRRLAEVLLVHDEQQEGNRWTWTVTAEPGSILKAVATGQLSLFAEGLGA